MREYAVQHLVLLVAIGIVAIHLRVLLALLLGIYLTGWMLGVMVVSLSLLLFVATVAIVVVYLLATSKTRDAMMQKTNSILRKVEA